MKEAEMNQIGELINQALVNCENEDKLKEIKAEVKNFCSHFPLYSILK
jgi:glycine/serine hydroxymethyltransferase